MSRLPFDRAREFLRARRIAVVGVSRNEKDFSRVILRELVRRGYDVVPVNPGLAEVEGRRCVPRLQEIAPPADAALLLTGPGATEQVLRDAVQAGIRKVWLHRGGGPGVGTPAALAFCEANGIETVHDLCPFMLFPDAPFPHRVHGFLRRTLGRAHPRPH
jgi:uncharacterized protein